MKTTLEIPDTLFRQAKAAAAAQGQTLKQLVNEALREKLAHPKSDAVAPWMQHFGCLKAYSTELRRIDAEIENDFERIDLEAWK